MNVEYYFTTNLFHRKVFTCNLRGLKANNGKYPRMGNCGWGGLPIYITIFIRLFCVLKKGQAFDYSTR